MPKELKIKINKKSILKKILLTAVGLAGTLALLYVAMWVAVFWALLGIWPFAPLEQVNESHSIANGGRIVIEGKEDRGFGSQGFVFQAGYLPPDSLTYEPIGGWIGQRARPEVFSVEDLVVVLNPDRKRLHVRTRAGTWKWFQMKFPDALSTFPISHYTALTSLSEQDLEKVRNEQNDAPDGYSPNAYIERFEPDNKELVITYYARPDRISTLVLGLTDEGTRLELKRIERSQNRALGS